MALDHHIKSRTLFGDRLPGMLDAADHLSIDRTLLQKLGVAEKLQQYKIDTEREAAEQHKQATIARTREQTLNALRQGKLPAYPYPTPILPFLSGNDTFLIWLFENVNYVEEKTHRQRVSNYAGMSYRGYHAGQSISESHEWSEMMPQGRGIVALTPKYIYFSATQKSFRIAYSKIVTVKPYSDAIEIVKEAANPKRQVFAEHQKEILHTSWFRRFRCTRDDLTKVLYLDSLLRPS